MALRLFLMGLVASLALDLPNGGLTKTSQTSRRWLDAHLAAPFPDAGLPLAALAIPPRADAVASATIPPQGEPTKPPVVAVEPKVAEDSIKPVAPVATINPTSTSESSSTVSVASPILPGRTEATAILAAEIASSLATDLLPSPTPTTVPMPMPMPMPGPEVAEDLVSPAAGAAQAPELPISLAATNPMALPPGEEVAVAPALAPAATPAPAVAETPKPADPDAAFSKVVGDLASRFAVEVSSVPKNEPKPLLAKLEVTPPPALPAEEVVAKADEPVEDLYPGLAYALNRASEGLSPSPFEPTTANREATLPSKPEPIAETLAEPSRSERLAQAVRLTGQAVNAWANLLGQRPAVVSIRR